MKIKDALDKRGIAYTDIKDKGERFTITFENESEKKLAIRALLKDDCAVTKDEGLKISGIKKKRFDKEERKPSDTKKGNLK